MPSGCDEYARGVRHGGPGNCRSSGVAGTVICISGILQSAFYSLARQPLHLPATQSCQSPPPPAAKAFAGKQNEKVSITRPWRRQWCNKSHTLYLGLFRAGDWLLLHWWEPKGEKKPNETTVISRISCQLYLGGDGPAFRGRALWPPRQSEVAPTRPSMGGWGVGGGGSHDRGLIIPLWVNAGTQGYCLSHTHAHTHAAVTEARFACGPEKI